MTLIRSLEAPSQREEFKQWRARAWEKNADYWLTGPLRHVTDVGSKIVDRVERLCRESTSVSPTVVDMGCGDAWLLRELRRRKLSVAYVGLDASTRFVEHGRQLFQPGSAVFQIIDLEVPSSLQCDADIVVNAFNFFELSDLREGFANANRFLKIGGRLLVSSIDKTYLLLALSSDMREFTENLRLYQDLPGVKFAFQAVDLGTGISDTLEYPSVLYSAENYLCSANEHGFALDRYAEDAFTGEYVPKIYCHYEFRKVNDVSPVVAR